MEQLPVVFVSSGGKDARPLGEFVTSFKVLTPAGGDVATLDISSSSLLLFLSLALARPSESSEPVSIGPLFPFRSLNISAVTSISISASSSS